MKMKADENEKTIKEHRDNTAISIEEIKTERVRIVERINTRIERLEHKHSDDVDDLREAIERAIQKIHTENREAHKQLFSKLDTLTEKVVGVCSTFSEYKNTHEVLKPHKKL
jgi:iron-sulfur cluster repair protein YtfE (RIC family)